MTLWRKAPESAHETSNEYPVACPELRDWWVAIIRKELERLGRVTAADREAAEATAVEEFALTDHQRKIQEVL